MYGPASAEVTSSVRIDEDVDALAELWTADAPEPERALRQHLLRAEFSKGWRCYVAQIDGRPAAYGALYQASNGVAVCAAAATAPAVRGQRNLQRIGLSLAYTRVTWTF